MGIWDGIDDPNLDNGADLKLPYLQPGKHRLRVRKIAQYESKKKKGEQWFRVDFDVLEGPDYGAVPACTWIVKLSLGDVAMRDVRRFVSALINVDKVDAGLMEELCGPGQSGAGISVKCEAVTATTQKGGEFTQVLWSPDDRKPLAA